MKNCSSWYIDIYSEMIICLEIIEICIVPESGSILSVSTIRELRPVFLMHPPYKFLTFLRISEGVVLPPNTISI
jgi:hypothetical protein